MKIRKRFLIALVVIAVISAGLFITQTRLFKPSIGARFARMIVKLYLAPAFHSDNLVNDVRHRLENISRLAILPSGTSVEEIDLGNMKADWVCAATVEHERKKVFLYIHGGGFFSGSRNTHRELVARISQVSGLSALVPEYRRAPEHKFPAALKDSLTAYQWLLNKGYSPKNIAIGGDSAGGCLVMMTLLSLRDAGTELPGAVFLISPLTDAVHHDGESMKTKAQVDPMFIDPKDQPRHLGLFTDNNRIKSPLLSPVHQNLSGLPPMLIQVGTDELLLNDSTRLAERAKEVGVDVTIQIWDGMWHDFQSFAVIAPEARDAIDKIGEFLKKRI